MTAITIPDLGDGIEKVTISCWHRAVGDAVAVGDDIVELVADKASFNIAAPSSGVVRDIIVAEGQDAAIGDTIGIIE